MIRLMRNKFGPIIVGTIVGFISFVFIFSIDFTPGGSGGAHAGTVNGQVISAGEFSRALEQRMRFFEQMNITGDQLKAFRIRQQVFQSLVSRKLMLQEAKRQGLMVSDEALREAIQQIPAFQTNGKFDPLQYRQVLEANRYSAGSFEAQLRDDLLVEQWQRYFESTAKVSKAEVDREYRMTHDRRMIRFVRLTPESARSAVQVGKKEIDAYLADDGKQKLVKSRFEARKDEPAFKGKKYDDVKREVARDLIAASKTDAIKKINDDLAEKVKSLMAQGASDAKINAALKAAGAKVESSGWVTRKHTFIPGVAGTKEVLDDAFAEKSPIAKTPKVYSSAGNVTVAMVEKAESARLAKMTDDERRNLTQQLAEQKQQEVRDMWLRDLTEKAEIEPNPQIVSDEV